MNLIALLLALCAVHSNIERKYSADGATYKAFFTYDDATVTFLGRIDPLNGTVYPDQKGAGQPHYDATFDLYREVPGGWLQIAQTVPGTYTLNGCVEDSIESLFYAVARQNPATVANNGIAKIGAAIHFTPLLSASGVTITNLDTNTTYTVLTNMLYCTRDIVPPDVPGVVTNMLDFTVPLTFITDWLLQSEWAFDTSTNVDSAAHFDTNTISTNLVAKMFYRGFTNWIVLEHRPVTNVLHQWHWASPQKVYDN